MDQQELLKQAISFVTDIEGPYKWYAIGIIATVVTALMSRFIFKTLKWFILLILLAVVILGALWALGRAANLV
ncbi:MAG: hypothetical protein U1C49_01670 [Candidatus Andersenbacteria bacterium]|nr:hypothetical protein [bacterium]MDZ4225534.1 hypothetical protein [Candidatus Andersenbacteria bacterium]